MTVIDRAAPAIRKGLPALSGHSRPSGAGCGGRRERDRVLPAHIKRATTLRGRERRQNLYQPRKLFDELCKLHRLQRNEIVLLHTLAKERRLDTPGLLFVHPEYFQTTSDREEDGFAEALADLRGRIFGDGRPDAA